MKIEHDLDERVEVRSLTLGQCFRFANKVYVIINPISVGERNLTVLSTGRSKGVFIPVMKIEDALGRNSFQLDFFYQSKMVLAVGSCLRIFPMR